LDACGAVVERPRVTTRLPMRPTGISFRGPQPANCGPGLQ
jgi:hypothetical protein